MGAAARRRRGNARRAFRSARRDHGAEVFVKLEPLQHTGAFKFRGAYNCPSRLNRSTCPDGVVAYSTGNPGQAIATVGRMLDVPTTVVMPSNAPGNRVEKARKAGARIVRYDRERQRREEVAAQLARERQYAVVPPGDHHHVIAGQATVAFETLERFGTDAFDAIVVPCGGGLSAGMCLAVVAAQSKAQVWAAEPSDFDDTRRSLASGQRETNPAGRMSICVRCSRRSRRSCRSQSTDRVSRACSPPTMPPCAARWHSASRCSA
ncbi:pyridoxal-phosphate dependent enzyme [Caballeronia glebae]